MNLTGTLFVAALGLCLAAAPAAVLTPRRARPLLAGAATTAAGLAGAAAGVTALSGQGWSARLDGVLPLAGVRLDLDPLGAMFVAVTGAVAVCAAVYGVAYARHGLDGRVAQATPPLFVASMLLVPAAASVSTLLVAWELMALTSLLLVLAEHRRRAAVGEAALWYAVMTHLGFAAILAGLAGFAALAGGETFEQLRAAGLPPGARDAVFLATLAGFASKAGIVPLHVWLARAHPEAPSQVSALMSAAMVNMGVYGILRVGLDLLHGGPAWWWLLVLGAGALSALFGILQAAVASDLKRLLGHSTTENMGLVLIGVGAAGFLASGGDSMLAALALAAALLHVVNHSAFKTLLFLAAGSVLHATGTRDLDALGGLRARMPCTTALFAVGALAASALPPGNGFVSEWLLLQSLIHALPTSGVAGAVTMPLAVGVIALSAGLAIATFVKAFGVGFLARPRTPGAERASESPPAMIGGMALAAASCVILALAPATVLPGLSRLAASLVPGSGHPPGPVPVSGEVTLRLTGYEGTISPLLIAVALAIAVIGLLGAVRLFASRRARRAARLWDCGAGPMSPRMEYTATSFAEPLQRVFDDVLEPESDLDVTPTKESAYLVESVRFRARIPDRIERRLYDPVLAAAGALGRAATGLANGSVHRYLAYGFYALTAVLVALAVIW
ncbi:proton-conducting transporter transmembrane domain-containing protein [Sphaerisporangium perillae]|uniref:proton-conducting transporter transmembrane domain-containing protein n=1 Tax=Sphaerisporangium perillae TaxID=2935860 RepID=UPI0020107551|nr:proton-conducting transporter membrane subunit [Sphaerisporangium perillae]